VTSRSSCRVDYFSTPTQVKLKPYTHPLSPPTLRHDQSRGDVYTVTLDLRVIKLPLYSCYALNYPSQISKTVIIISRSVQAYNLYRMTVVGSVEKNNESVNGQYHCSGVMIRVASIRIDIFNTSLYPRSSF